MRKSKAGQTVEGMHTISVCPNYKIFNFMDFFALVGIWLDLGL